MNVRDFFRGARRARGAPNEKSLRPVHPNAGLEAAYRRKLLALVDEMQRSVEFWLRAQYRKTPPAIAADETPSAELNRAIRQLADRWDMRFARAADALARWFAQKVQDRSDVQLRQILREAGFSIDWKMTAVMRDIMNATVSQQVGLIRSIPARYLGQVEGLVMRSVTTGRDVAGLMADLQKQFGVTRRRAALIARTQNNMATASMTRARQLEAGITEAIWVHSLGGREPRPTHLRAGKERQRYDVSKGWFDPHEGRYIFPGELINCFPGSTKVQFADNIEKGYRRWYSGELTEIITNYGKTVRATHNHPILTPDGWIAIGSLNEGDCIFEIADDIGKTIIFENHEDYAVPSFSEVFDALTTTDGARSEIALGGRFHGDIADGDVDIILTARSLSFGRQPGGRKSIENLSLAVSHFSDILDGACMEAGGRIGLASPRDMSISSEGGSSLGAEIVHSDLIGRAAPSNLASDRFDASDNRISGDPVAARKRKNAFASLMGCMKLARIVRVNRSSFEGHVFNLQTKEGWYIAAGIIGHNCRCTSKPVVKGFS